MNYWQTAEEAGLTQDQINEIAEKLWKERKAEATQSCPDCAVAPGQPHETGCDVARCTNCGGQALSCSCITKGIDIWLGLWPGIKECYEQKLICRGNFGKGDWRFDLNTEAMLRMRE